MVFKEFMVNMIQNELEDVVGEENVSVLEADKLTYGVDYFWISRMWADKGKCPPKPDFIVLPASAEEVSKILKIANYYKIPVHTWGGGSGSQGSALPMAGGIILDTKRMNRLLDINIESRIITAETGMIFQNLEWFANEHGYSVMHIPSCLTCGTVGGAHSDSHMQAIVCSNLSNEDVLFAISHSGSSKDIVDSTRIAKSQGAKTISLTNIGVSPLNKITDIQLYTASKETKYRIVAMSSRIAQMAVIDSIYTIIAARTPTVVETFRKIEKMLNPKKY
jgi:alkyldihydroxyacetonephosphate synthase